MEAKGHAMHFSGTKAGPGTRTAGGGKLPGQLGTASAQPGRFEAMLKTTSVVIISDVEAKHFQLYPSFFEASSTRVVVPSYPDRLISLKNWVADGGGLMMLGGWLSFSGMEEKAGWRRTPMGRGFASKLPGRRRPGRFFGGFTPEVLMPEHPLVKGLAWKSFLGSSATTSSSSNGRRRARTSAANRPSAAHHGQMGQGQGLRLFIGSRALLGNQFRAMGGVCAILAPVLGWLLGR